MSKGKKTQLTNVNNTVLMNIQDSSTKHTEQRRNKSELSDELLKRLISSLEHTNHQEFTCDEVFALVDEYAEAELRGEDVAHLKPLLRRHLDLCSECKEEYQALLRVLEGTAT